MPRTIERPARQPLAAPRVTPSIIDSATGKPFTLDQELTPFGAWVGEPLWAPPQGLSTEFAETMLRESRPFASRESRWNAIVKKHRKEFTQVREIDLFQASIRLPAGKFFVSVTDRADFDKITDPIPRCVQTRLEEFLNGPGNKRGVKFYYFKPLCVEIGNELILTTREDLVAAITKVSDEIFAEYRRRAIIRRPQQACMAVANTCLALPRAAISYFISRKQRAVNAFRAKLEFERRKLALSVATTHRMCRTSGCTFDEALEMTSPLNQRQVVEQYCIEQELSQAQRRQMLLYTSEAVPWFVTLMLTATYLSTMVLTGTATVAMSDPAFVAEMPNSPGVLLKIGHFDEIDGVTHVEI